MTVTVLPTHPYWLAVREEETAGVVADTLAGITFLPVMRGSGMQVNAGETSVTETHSHRAKDTNLVRTLTTYQGQISGPVYPEESTALLRMVFGNDTVTKISVSGTPDVYQHVLKMDNTTPIPATIFDNLFNETGYINSYGWGMVNKLTLSFAPTGNGNAGWLGYTAELMALSKSYQTSALPAPVYASDLPFPAYKAAITKGGSSFTGLLSFNCTFSNEVEVFPGGNTTNPREGTAVLPGFFSVTASAVLVLSRAEFEKYTNDTEEAWVISFTGRQIQGAYNYSISLSFPKMRIKAAPVDYAGNYFRLNASYTAVYDSSSQSPATCTVVNTKSAGSYASLLLDSFNRADESPTTTPEVGPAYDNAGVISVGYAPLSVVSNTLKLVIGTNGASDFGSIAADVGTADVNYQVKISTLAGRIIFYVRAFYDLTDVDIYGYYVEINLATDNKARLYYYHGSPAYSYDLVGTSSSNFASGDIVNVVASAGSIIVKRNGTTEISITGAVYQDKTICGISIIQNTSAALDDWSILGV